MLSPKLSLILGAAAMTATLPLVAAAEPMDHAEAQMFQHAGISLQQAGQSAIQQHQGALAAVSFNDEDGRGIYEATVVGTDGHPWTVKIDAANGHVLASGATAMMGNDHRDTAQAEQGDGDGETDDG